MQWKNLPIEEVASESKLQPQTPFDGTQGRYMVNVELQLLRYVCLYNLLVVADPTATRNMRDNSEP